MHTTRVVWGSLATLGLCFAPAMAQVTTVQNSQVERMDRMPIYRVNVVARTTMPSDVVVMENVIRADTVGKIEEIDAKYELLPRGQYTMNVNPGDLRKRAIADPRRPLEVLEARNAVQIAQWAGADRYAGDTYQKAAQLLDEAENYQMRHHPEKKPAAMIAREAVQTAEDARLITLKRI